MFRMALIFMPNQAVALVNRAQPATELIVSSKVAMQIQSPGKTLLRTTWRGATVLRGPAAMREATVVCGVASIRGFTLIELIMVIVILGVLAVFAAPRIINSDDFNARGFHDETLSLLRFAQKTAVAQRRTVCVTLADAGVSMYMDTSTPPDGACDASPAVALPNTPRGGKGLTAKVDGTVVTAFQFTSLGSTNQAANVDITITNSSAITVETGTGYVHD
jgi:MSHA pilin protein MshC